MPKRPTGRSNGCARTPDPLQALSWVALPLFLASFILLSLPPLPPAAQAVLAVVYALLTLLLLFAAGKTTLSDPTDPDVRRALYSMHLTDGSSEGEKGGLRTPTRSPGSKKCYVCKVYRRPLTEHCRVCNTCVETFDHHCKWLNNCVGSQNYQLFFATLSATTLHVLVHTLVAASALVAYAVSYRIDGAVDVLRIVLQSVSLALSIIFEVLLVQLWYFHIKLIQDDTTTYEMSTGQTNRSRRINKMQTGAGSSVFPAQDANRRACSLGAGTPRPSFCVALIFPLNPSLSRAVTKEPWVQALGGTRRATDDYEPALAGAHQLRVPEAP